MRKIAIGRRLPREHRLGACTIARCDRRASRGIIAELAHLPARSPARRRGDQNAVLPVLYEIRDRADIASDHGKPRGDRLGEHVAECLLVRSEDEQVRLSERSAISSRLERTREANLAVEAELGGERTKRVLLRAATRDHQLEAAARKERPRSEQIGDSFALDQSAHGETSNGPSAFGARTAPGRKRSRSTPFPITVYASAAASRARGRRDSRTRERRAMRVARSTW